MKCLFSIDRKIAKGIMISPTDAVAILNEGIRLHEWAQKTFDPATTLGKDHVMWILRYENMIAYIHESMIVYITEGLGNPREMIFQLIDDIGIHQWYINHPEYAVGNYGNVKHHQKWVRRWTAVKDLLEEDIV